MKLLLQAEARTVVFSSFYRLITVYCCERLTRGFNTCLVPK